MQIEAIISRLHSLTIQCRNAIRRALHRQAGVEEAERRLRRASRRSLRPALAMVHEPLQLTQTASIHVHTPRTPRPSTARRPTALEMDLPPAFDDQQFIRGSVVLALERDFGSVRTTAHHIIEVS